MSVHAMRVKDLGRRVLWVVGSCAANDHYVVTSYAEPTTGPETFVFAADFQGNLSVPREDLPGSLREADAHKKAIDGYVRHLNGEDVALPEFTAAELFERAGLS